MPRLPKAGAVHYSWVTREALQHHLCSSRVPSLSPAIEKKVVQKLNLAVGAWFSENEYRLNVRPAERSELHATADPWDWRTKPEPVIQSETVLGRLVELRAALAASEALLTLPKEGLHPVDEVRLETRARVLRSLAVNSRNSSQEAAARFLASFCRQMNRVVHACAEAERLATQTKRKPRSGPKEMSWFDRITEASVLIANKSNTKNLLAIARGLEGLLPTKMRSPSPDALGKRLQRSLRRIRRPQATR